MSGSANTAPVRQLPSDVLTERALLGVMIYNPLLIHVTRDYLDEGEVFYHYDHRTLYTAIIDVFDHGQTVRYLTLHRHLLSVGQGEVDSRVGISDLINEGIALGTSSDVVINAASYLRTLSTKRDAYKQIATMGAVARGTQTIEELAYLNEQLGLILSGKAMTSSSEHISVSMDKVVDEIMNAEPDATGPTGVPTGLGKLDRATGGWMPEEYVLMIARPGVGKTALALKLIDGATSNGVPTAFISLEMSQEANDHRLLSSYSLVPYSSYRRKRHKDGRPLSDEDKQRTFEAGQQIKQLPIYFYVKPSFDVHDVCYFIKDEIRRHKIGMVVIDYLGLLADRENKSGNSENARVAAVSRAIRASCKQTGIPHIVLHQMNRSAEGRDNPRPRISDIRDSGQIEQDANIILGLYRDDYYKAQRAKDDGDSTVAPDDHIMEIEILKSRNDSTGTIECWSDMETNRILDEKPFDYATYQQQRPTMLSGGKPVEVVYDSEMRNTITANESIAGFESATPPGQAQLPPERGDDNDYNINDTPF